MLPREFLARYGQVKTTFLVSANTDPIRIQEDADRYLLCFWATAGDFGIQPTGQADFVISPQRFVFGSPPIFLTHALHGALVNTAWFIVPTISGQDITYMEGFMRPVQDQTQPVGTVEGYPVNQPRSVSQQLPASLVTPPEEELPYIPPVSGTSAQVGAIDYRPEPAFVRAARVRGQRGPVSEGYVRPELAIPRDTWIRWEPRSPDQYQPNAEDYAIGNAIQKPLTFNQPAGWWYFVPLAELTP